MCYVTVTFPVFSNYIPKVFLKYAKVYLRDVISTSEARSWFKLDRGNEYAIFLSVPIKFSVPIRKIHGDAHRDNLNIVFRLLSLIY